MVETNLKINHVTIVTTRKFTSIDVVKITPRLIGFIRFLRQTFFTQIGKGQHFIQWRIDF